MDNKRCLRSYGDRFFFCGRSQNSAHTRMYSHAKERCTDLSQQLFANKHTQTDTIFFALTDVRRKTIDLMLSQFCTSLTITRRSYEVQSSSTPVKISQKDTHGNNETRVPVIRSLDGGLLLLLCCAHTIAAIGRRLHTRTWTNKRPECSKRIRIHIQGIYTSLCGCSHQHCSQCRWLHAQTGIHQRRINFSCSVRGRMNASMFGSWTK